MGTNNFGDSRMLTFDELRAANDARQKEWPGSDQADVSFRTLEVGGEVGELLEAVKKHLRAKRGIMGTTAAIDDVAMEMADVLIALDLLAAQMGIDLGHAARLKFNRTSAKYDLKTRL